MALFLCSVLETLYWSLFQSGIFLVTLRRLFVGGTMVSNRACLLGVKFRVRRVRSSLCGYHSKGIGLISWYVVAIVKPFIFITHVSVQRTRPKTRLAYWSIKQVEAVCPQYCEGERSSLLASESTNRFLIITQKNTHKKLDSNISVCTSIVDGSDLM